MVSLSVKPNLVYHRSYHTFTDPVSQPEEFQMGIISDLQAPGCSERIMMKVILAGAS
jgi:hypothetical protein